MPVDTKTEQFDEKRSLAEAEIKNLSHRYALALDRSDFEEWETLFTSDVVWQTAGRPAFSGLTEVMEVPRRLHGAFKNTFHAVLTQVVKFSGADTTGIVYCAAHHLIDYDFVSPGRDPIGMSYQFLMRYEDKYRKEDGRWKFAARKLIMVTRQIDQIVQFAPDGTWSAAS
ncbi:nuclear transport factor 2 family protein [Bradyrhizobium sp. WYCCWR 13022]|uniref:nuclear transport factor 2 family protein n=1 Tax=unclassified Bradyrhizobium TaxID=2631580 RepID=UPI00263BBFCE|nr:nuclear transport factor 2 family protein [Bradyrhizobium sp. WYCCWR 13022]MDN4984324.1 nuclear transport factor 2 family protein [Bradyrhizobium sp. WYCCWR 13022]